MEIDLVRVIAGTARGTKLIAPPGFEVRPTLDRVREALFSILMPRLEDTAFLDLFSGTGAIGIEALSRGAKTATFVDQDARSMEVLRRNLEATHFTANARVHRLALPGGLRSLTNDPVRYDLVFIDPPYAFEAYTELLDQLPQSGLLTDDAIVVVEHNARKGQDPLTEVTGLTRYRVASYGETALSFFSQNPA